MGLVGGGAQAEAVVVDEDEAIPVPEGLSLDLAQSTYSYVLSAFGGHNRPTPTGRWWHLRRCPHPNHLWELELQVQSLLELRETNVDADAGRRSVTTSTRGTSSGGSAMNRRRPSTTVVSFASDRR